MSVGSSPFINSTFGHPNFNNPVKIGTRSNTASESKSSKLSKPQDKHQNVSVNRYSRKKNHGEGGKPQVTMQIEEEEDLDEFSLKHVASARYLRNHRLINEIFGDTVVPDVRSVITENRINQLKRQVQSLAMHQKKMEVELQQIDDKFQTKKRKLKEASDQFQEDLKKACLNKPIDEAEYKRLVEEELERLKAEQKKIDDLKKQQAEEADKIAKEAQEHAKQQESAKSNESEVKEDKVENDKPVNDSSKEKVDEAKNDEKMEVDVSLKEINDKPADNQSNPVDQADNQTKSEVEKTDKPESVEIAKTEDQTNEKPVENK